MDKAPCPFFLLKKEKWTGSIDRIFRAERDLYNIFTFWRFQMVENQNTEEPKIEQESVGGEAAVQTKHTGFLGKVDNYFGITKMKSNFKTEMLAGLTTFMTMV